MKHLDVSCKQWNNKNTGFLDDYTRKTNKKFWWICDKGHEWEAPIRIRNKNIGCPYCSNKKVCIDKCLATLRPDLAKEWHPIKNGDITPYDIVSKTTKKFWWLCSKGHEWEVRASVRNNVNCPYCAHQKVCLDTCLMTIYPNTAKLWNYNKNELTPYNVFACSKKKVWWKCDKGHEWELPITYQRENMGCPYCSNQKVGYGNSLAESNSPIVKEWHPTKNVLNPYEVSIFNNKKAWWLCSKGHEWEAAIHSRHTRNCPYCSGKKASLDNCIATVNPELAIQWHPTKNGILTPYDVTIGQAKKVWWQCKNGHEWIAAIYCRKNSGCPYCKSSLGKQEISRILDKHNISYIKEYRTRECIDKKPLPFDFKVGSKLIEYHGEQHEKPIRFRGISLERATELFINLQKRDEIKRKYCEDNNIPLLVIWYYDFDNIEKLLIEYINKDICIDV